MCLIIYKKKDSILSDDIILDAWCSNIDGAGFMFADKGKLHIHKGFMNFDVLLNVYHRYLKACPESDFVLHFRLATSGEEDKDNCHPFRINKDLAFVHNGIFIEYHDNKKLSDTALFNKKILQRLPEGFLDNKGITYLLKEYCSESYINKLVFMNNLGKVTIINEKFGKWMDGSWYSNCYSMTMPVETSIITSTATSGDTSIVKVGKEEVTLYDNKPYYNWMNSKVIDGHSYCCVCEEVISKEIMIEIGGLWCCDNCRHGLNGYPVYCDSCNTYVKYNQDKICCFCGESLSLEKVLEYFLSGN